MYNLWIPHRSIVTIVLLWLSELLNSTSEHMLIFVNLVLMKDKSAQTERSCNRKWGFTLTWNDRKSKAQMKEGGLTECRASFSQVILRKRETQASLPWDLTLKVSLSFSKNIDWVFVFVTVAAVTLISRR